MTASALENHLIALEGKVEELLAEFEGQGSSNQDTNLQDRDCTQSQEGETTPEERSR